MVEILQLFKGGDTPAEDQKMFLKAQILYWLIGATDGHAKNFSIFLGPGGRFRMTPLYDILTAQPSLVARQIVRKQMKLAMSVGEKRHYAIDYIQGRHFKQTAERAGLPGAIAGDALEEIARDADQAMETVSKELPLRFPRQLHDCVQGGLVSRLRKL
jgi:serine/threonine-protein kinase HipA